MALCESYTAIVEPSCRYALFNPAYADYEAVMTVDEAKVLAAKFAPNATLDHFRERMNDLDRKLANHDGIFDRVQITVFEWSSGL